MPYKDPKERRAYYASKEQKAKTALRARNWFNKQKALGLPVRDPIRHQKNEIKRRKRDKVQRLIYGQLYRLFNN
jgi:hypothetical protein